jgi:hypothetical protein
MTAPKDYEFYIVDGTIIDERTDSETRVYGQIRGDGMHGHSSVSGNINSETIKSQQFWLKQNNGKEIHIDLDTYTIPLRSGHDVIMVFVDNYTIPSLLYIKNTEKLYTLYNKIEKFKSSCILSILAIIISIAFGMACASSGNVYRPGDNVGTGIFFGFLFFIGQCIAYAIIIDKKYKKKNETIMNRAEAILRKHISGK